METYIYNGVTYNKVQREAKEGDLVLVTGNTFNLDPHLHEIGEVVEIEMVIPEVEDVTKVAPLIYLLSGGEITSLPKRYRSKGTNLVVEDYVVLEEVPQRGNRAAFLDVAEYDGKLYTVEHDLNPTEGDLIVMLEEDYAEGFEAGDVFRVQDDNELIFIDNDGDYRDLDGREYAVLVPLK